MSADKATRTDPENAIPQQSQNHRDIWHQLCEDFNTNRNEIEKYAQSKNQNRDMPINRAVEFLDKEIFPLLNDALMDTFKKAILNDCLNVPKSTFNGIDNIAEYLWNKNPKYPDRHDKNVYIHDMDWVHDYLKETPRPFFPFHLVWSRKFAALKIQAYIKGYWIRKREDVQEVRNFWKQWRYENTPELFVKSTDNLNVKSPSSSSHVLKM